MVVLIVLWSLSVPASLFAFSGGRATEGGPYIITDVNGQLDMSTTLLAHYALSADIDATSRSMWNDDGTDTGALGGFKPVGYHSNPPGTAFTGTFDGRCHAIRNLFINHPSASYSGLFSSVSGGSASVRDVTLEDVRIAGAPYTGGQCAGAAELPPHAVAGNREHLQAAVGHGASRPAIRG